MATVDIEDPARPESTVEVAGTQESPTARPTRVFLESLPFAVVAVGIAAWVYRAWDQSWSRPFRTYGPDVYFIEAMVKALQDHGWYFNNPSLNAPFGQQFYDYPHAGENLQLALIRLFTLVTGNPGQAVNLYYLTGFGLLTMVTFAVFRHLRFGPWTAGSVALLYTFLPYHFWHMEDHLYRSTYLSAPLAALLLLWALSWRTAFLVDPDGPTWGVRSLLGNLHRKRAISAVLLLAAVSTFETMTLAFFLTVLALASIILAIRRRDVGHLAVLGAAIAVCGLAFAVSMSPNLRYWAANGTNKDTGRRVPTEQESFGLQLSQLVLPVPHHRIKALGDLQTPARKKSSISGEGGQELGFIGAAGLLVTLYWALTAGVRRKVREPFHDRSVLREHASLLTLVLIPVATVSGFALILSISGFAQVRVWNRTVVLIGFYALLAVAMGIERFLDRDRSASRSPFGRRWVAIGGLALVTALGIADTAVLRSTPDYGKRADLDELQPFVARAEHALPHNGMVFQFPVTPFPETPAKGSTQEYDQLLPYLWSHDLRWSAGGMRGRPDADWQLTVFAKGESASLPGLAGLGFAAIEIDTHGYVDGGVAALAALRGVLGPPTIISGSGRWQLWDLQAWARRSRLSPAAARAAATGLVGDQLDRALAYASRT